MQLPKSRKHCCSTITSRITQRVSQRRWLRFFESLESRILLSRLAYAPGVGLLADTATASPYLLPQTYLETPNGYLTAPSSDPALTIARNYLSTHAAALGLSPQDLLNAVVTDQYTDTGTGLTHIYLAQQFNGLEIGNTSLTITVTSNGQLLNVAGGFVPNVARYSAAAAKPQFSAAQAAHAATALGLPDSTASFVTGDATLQQRTVLSDAALSLDPITAQLKYLATPTGVELVWNMPLRTPDQAHWYDFNVDAQTGLAAETFDWVDYASYNVFAQPIEAPNDGSRTIITDTYDPAASPFGWQDTNGVPGAEFTDTRGNNVSAQEDVDANNSGGFRPDGGASLNFDFPLDLSQAPSAYQSAAITNLFYWNNLCHDIHYKYGFTEAAGNFQTTNYTGQGLGNDAVQADAQDGSGTNNANFDTPPDGYAPRMQMYLFTYTTPYRDGDLDNMIIVHEYGHGVSNRLTGGPANTDALDAIQSSGMGEGWSDWWALMFTQKPADTQNATYPLATYVLGQSTSGAGLRRYPYSFDMTKDPETISYFNTDEEVHATGEIWCSTLWDLNWLLINKYGYNPNLAQGYTGVSSAGNILALQLIMDALKIQPASPSFKDARDAILQADQALTGGANKYQIWIAFARRGMGYSFVDSSANAMTVTAAFDLPPGLQNPVVVSQNPFGIVNTPISALDVTFSKAMDTTSFSIADDINSFTGPGGVDLKSQVSTFAWTNSNLTLHLTFASPLSLNGLYSLSVGPNILAAVDGHAMDENDNGTPGEAGDAYTASFRYDALLGQVTSTVPANNSVVTLPLPSIDFNFNEAFNPASISASDLTANHGSVTGVTFLNGNTTARFTLSGIDTENSLSLSIAAGAITDADGNPMAAYSGSLVLDVATAAFPALSAVGAAGTLVYSGTVSGSIATNSDTDSYTFALDSGQLLTLVGIPTSSLRPALEVRDPSNNLIASTGAVAYGSDALLQSIPILTAGTYTVTISSVSAASSGNYTLQATLNAALEAEQYSGPTDDTFGTAQNLDSAFLHLVPGSSAKVASVLGKTPAPTGTPVYSESFESGALGAAWSTYSSLATGRIQVTGAYTTADGSYALIMDNNDSTGSEYNLNEAIWTVDLHAVVSPSLVFSTISYNDDMDVLPASFSGHFIGDGVSISADGVNWYTVWTNSAPSDWAPVAINLVNAAAAAGITLGANFQIKFQQFDNYSLKTDGRGYDAIAITTPASNADYYSFSLSAGQSATVAVKRFSGSTTNLGMSLFAASGNKIAAASTTAANFDDVIADFVSPAGGTYYVYVTGDQASDYALTVSVNSTLNIETNDSYNNAQSLQSSSSAGQYTVLGAITSSDSYDVYGVTLTAGTPITLRTSTPADGAGRFDNTFNPRLRLLSSTGSQLAVDDNSAPDGRNAILTYAPTSSGTYYVEVSSTTASSTIGEYVLTLDGVSAAVVPFTVTSSIPANNSASGTAPTTATIVLSNSLLLTSLQASDLRLDGQPATAFTVTGDHTIVFTLPGGLATGVHTLTIHAGDLTDLDGTPIAAFSSTFTLDLLPPRITNSSIEEGDVEVPGAITYSVTFSKAMLATNLDTTDFLLKGNFKNVLYTPSYYAYSVGNTVLTLSYSSLPEDSYTLTLLSGDGRFEDTNGLDLDGEANFPIPPNMSGNGVAGGNFAVDFTVDNPTSAFPTPLTSVAPAGSIIYSGSTSGVLASVTDTDAFTLNLDAGQTLSLVLHPTTATLRPIISVTGPTGTYTVTAAAANQDAVLQSVAITTSGTYTITTASADSTTGFYTLQAYLNTALTAAQHGGPSNDSIATAQNIDTSTVGVGTGSRGAVLGRTAMGGSLPSETEPNDTLATANSGVSNFTPYSGNIYHLGIKGAVTLSGDKDWYNLGALDVGDVITISLCGSPSARGALADAFLYFYRNSGGNPAIVTFDDGNGTGDDALIYRFTITTADTYYVVAKSASTYTTGSYDLGIELENTGSAPLCDQSVTTETEPNDSAATATNVSHSWRSVSYISHTTAALTSGDNDFFQYQFTAGDLVTVDMKSTGNMRPKVSLLNSAGSVIALEDGTSGTSHESPLYGYIIPTTGLYYVQVSQYSGTGAYSADIYLSTNTAPPGSVVHNDYYSYTAKAGNHFSFVISPLAGSTSPDVSVRNASNTVLATATAGFQNVGKAIADFVAPADGTYYLTVPATATPTDYALIFTSNGAFDLEPNTVSSPQNLNGCGNVLGTVGSDGDYFSVHLTAGQALTYLTTTPGGGSGEFANTLDPALEILNATGNTTLASNDNGAPDGRNALLSFTPTTTGTYLVHILATKSTSGEYTLQISANSPPVAVGDSAFVIPSTARLINVLTNDSDPDNDALTITSAGSPLHGTAALQAQSILYTPTPGFTGGDNFTYTISDGHGGTASATVSLSVTPPLPGDATLDGKVTGADYTVWADHYGLTGQTWMTGDFTGDGKVTGADYTVWADHYGQVLAPIPSLTPSESAAPSSPAPTATPASSLVDTPAAAVADPPTPSQAIIPPPVQDERLNAKPSTIPFTMLVGLPTPAIRQGVHAITFTPIIHRPPLTLTLAPNVNHAYVLPPVFPPLELIA